MATSRNPLKLLGVVLRLPASQTEKRDWLETEVRENGVYWSMTTRKPPSYNLASAKEITKRKGPGDYPSPSKWWWRYVFLVFMLRKIRSKTVLRPIGARFMHQKEVAHYERQI